MTDHQKLNLCRAVNLAASIRIGGCDAMSFAECIISHVDAALNNKAGLYYKDLDDATLKETAECEVSKARETARVFRALTTFKEV